VGRGPSAMVGIDSDRNLVYGILAVQLGFIQRETLVDAMQAWVLDQGKPLGRILLDRGDLIPDEDSQLEALVRRHLRRHDDDPQRSLAELCSLNSVRQVLARIGATEAKVSLAGADTRVDGTSTDREPRGAGAGLGSPSEEGYRFRVIGPHARGGLGEVFLALDTEL